MKTLDTVTLRSIPKVELHRHLDCSMRWSTFCELAPQLGLKLDSDPTARRDRYLITSPMLNLDSVLKKFLASQKILSSEEILTRLAFEACEDAFNDGVLILELRYAPTFIADGHPQLSFQKIHDAFLKGIAQAQEKFPMAVGLICILQRIKPIKVCENAIDFAIENKDTFIGVDLADNEEGFDPKPFESLFHRAKKSGFRITIHSGEAPHKDSSRWIQDSIDILGAERIGHGVQAINDKNVLALLIKKKIPLEICPWSNYLTQAFPSLEAHPVKKLWEAGVLITLNADDPGIFDSRLTDDYAIAHSIHNMQLEDFQRMNDIAASYSFLKLEHKQKIWPRKILSPL